MLLSDIRDKAEEMKRILSRIDNGYTTFKEDELEIIKLGLETALLNLEIILTITRG
jgi:hypothetical protein